MADNTEELRTLLTNLSRCEVGTRNASSERLFALVYDELHQLASDRLRRERPGHTLQPTALVNEVYLRLVAGEHDKSWDNTGHFFAAAARAMRQILIDNARRKLAQKRSADGKRIDIELEDVTQTFDDERLVELNDALVQLEQEDPDKARLVELKFFGGLNMDQICDVLQLSRATAHRHLKQAQAWLFLRIVK